MTYLVICRQEFSKTIVIFEVSTLKLFKFQKFSEKRKCINLGPKLDYLGILVLEL